MELPDPFLPGAVSLLDQLDKKLVVVLRDGKTLIGYLRTLDQVFNFFINVNTFLVCKFGSTRNA